MNTFIRLTGCGIMIFTAFLWGRKRAEREEYSLKLLADFIAFVRYTRENIIHTKTPIPDICREYETDIYEMREFLADSEKNGICAAWDKHSAMLPQKAQKAVQRFVSNIGFGYDDEDKELCEYTLNILGGLFAELKSKTDERRKMWYTLPPLFVSSIILILM